MADTEIETQLPAPQVFYQNTRLQKKGNTIFPTSLPFLFPHIPPSLLFWHHGVLMLLTSWTGLQLKIIPPVDFIDNIEVYKSADELLVQSHQNGGEAYEPDWQISGFSPRSTRFTSVAKVSLTAIHWTRRHVNCTTITDYKRRKCDEKLNMKAREKLLSNRTPYARYFSPQFFGMSDPFQ